MDNAIEMEYDGSTRIRFPEALLYGLSNRNYRIKQFTVRIHDISDLILVGSTSLAQP